MRDSYKLILRKCKCGCGAAFRVLETSTALYASRTHDPAFIYIPPDKSRIKEIKKLMLEVYGEEKGEE